MPPVNHPHPFEYLEELTRPTTYDPQRSFKDQLRAIDVLRERSQSSREDGDLENAYIYLGRAATLINAHLPDHSQYDMLTTKQQVDLANNGRLMLRSVQELEPQLRERYRAYEESIVNGTLWHTTGRRLEEEEKRKGAARSQSPAPIAIPRTSASTENHISGLWNRALVGPERHALTEAQMYKLQVELDRERREHEQKDPPDHREALILPPSDSPSSKSHRIRRRKDSQDSQPEFDQSMKITEQWIKDTQNIFQRQIDEAQRRLAEGRPYDLYERTPSPEDPLLHIREMPAAQNATARVLVTQSERAEAEAERIDPQPQAANDVQPTSQQSWQAEPAQHWNDATASQFFGRELSGREFSRLRSAPSTIPHPVAVEHSHSQSPTPVQPPIARPQLSRFSQPQSAQNQPTPFIPTLVPQPVSLDVPRLGRMQRPQHSRTSVAPPQSSEQYPNRGRSVSYTSSSPPIERRDSEANPQRQAALHAWADEEERDRDLQQGYTGADDSENSDDSEDLSNNQGDPEIVHSRISSLLRKMGIDASQMIPPAWEGAVEMSYRVHSRLESCIAGSDEYAETLKLLQDLCFLSGRLPSSYELQNVTFDRSKVIGRGGEATVYRGQANGKNIVVREVVLSQTEWASHVGRKVIQQSLIHSFIIPTSLAFLGIFHEAIGSPPIMVLPYIEKGSVNDLILNSTDPILVAHFAQIITGIGRGVAYLHSRNPPIVHGDIHPGNVLLDASYKPFLCDFGLSRISHEVTRTRTMLHEGGRTRFLAPELSDGTTDRFRTTQASDIFSLSMTFLNIWTRQHPFCEIRKELKVAAKLRDRQRPKRPKGAIDLIPDVEERFWRLLVDMWAHEPSTRPSSQTVRDTLDRIFERWLG